MGYVILVCMIVLKCLHLKSMKLTNKNIADNYTNQIITETTGESLIQAHVESSVIYEGLTDTISLTTNNPNLYNNPENKVNDTQIPELATNESLGSDNTLNYLSDRKFFDSGSLLLRLLGESFTKMIYYYIILYLFYQRQEYLDKTVSVKLSICVYLLGGLIRV